eukprot:2592682-Prymnesium_polylepis.1
MMKVERWRALTTGGRMGLSFLTAQAITRHWGAAAAGDMAAATFHNLARTTGPQYVAHECCCCSPMA